MKFSRTDIIDRIINLKNDLEAEQANYAKLSKSSPNDDNLAFIHRKKVEQFVSQIEMLQYLYSQREEDELPIYEDVEFESKCEIILPDFESITLELIEYFSEHPEMLVELKWRKFEELLESIFSNHGYLTELGPGTNDGGVDLRLIQKDSIGSILTLVQAKKFKTENPINLQPVQALYGAVESEKANRGIFVTTSRYLPCARKFAENQGERLFLADSNNIAEWCNKVMKNKK